MVWIIKTYLDDLQPRAPLTNLRRRSEQIALRPVEKRKRLDRLRRDSCYRGRSNPLDQARIEIHISPAPRRPLYFQSARRRDPTEVDFQPMDRLVIPPSTPWRRGHQWPGERRRCLQSLSIDFSAGRSSISPGRKRRRGRSNAKPDSAGLVFLLVANWIIRARQASGVVSEFRQRRY